VPKAVRCGSRCFQIKVTKKYGIFRSEGFSERALFVIDKRGIIRYIDVHDINERPSFVKLAKALEALNHQVKHE
jgi:peroxiredoxin (alkyl hydroperoxide reductase subunit C)